MIWISQFLTMAGMSSVIPFLPLFIREMGVETQEAVAGWSGLIFAGPFIISFFMAPVWGAVGDKYGRKLMILRAVFGLGIAQFLMSVAQSPAQLLIFRLFQGTLSGFYPSAMALTAASTPKQHTNYALGLVQSASSAGNIVGPVIGGVLSDIFGFRAVFMIVGVLLSLTGVLVLLLVKEERNPETEEPSSSLIANWKDTLSDRSLRVAVIIMFLATFGVSLVQPIFVLYVETFSISPAMLPTVTGALYSVLGIFSTISAAVLGKRADKKGVRKTLVAATLVTGIMYLLHYIIPSVWLLVPVRIFLGLGYGVILPVIYARMSLLVSNERKGGILGVGSSFQILGIMLGSLFSGGLVSMIGLHAAFLAAGGIFLLNSLIARSALPPHTATK